MTLKLSECLTLSIGTPHFVLNLTSTLTKAYPAFLKASMLLNRFVQ